MTYVEVGSGSPVVVLEAGLGETSATWLPLRPHLVGLGRIIAYDRAGLGASNPDPGLRTVERLVDDLQAVVDEVAGEAVLLVGHSLGGLIVGAFARLQPNRVTGLVLLDPTPEDVLADVPRALRALQAGVLRGARLASVCGIGSRQRARTAWQEYAGLLASVDWLRRLRSTHNLPPVPITVISASKAGLAGSARAHLNRVHAALVEDGRGRHLIAEGAGHYLHRDRPELVAEAIRAVALAATHAEAAG